MLNHWEFKQYFKFKLEKKNTNLQMVLTSLNACKIKVKKLMTTKEKNSKGK